MKIAIDLDDTLSVVDRVTRAQGYIDRMGLPFKLIDENAHELVDVFDWALPDVLEFVPAGGGTHRHRAHGAHQRVVRKPRKNFPRLAGKAAHPIR